jgi:hypothetical protein
MEDEEPLYPDTTPVRHQSSSSVAFRSDQFFGKSASAVVKEILVQRGARNLGAISLGELFKTMQAGGFVFANPKEQIAKRNLAISLAANRDFTRVPHTGHVGLTEWYRNVRNGTEAH